MNKMNPIKYIENMLSHHPKSLSLWITEGIVINDKRYIIKEFRLRDGKLYAVIAEDKYKPKYFEVQLCPDEETLKGIYKAIKDNKIAIYKEITDREREIARVDNAIKENTAKIDKEISDRQNDINRVDKSIEANTAKINQEITDRTNEINRVDNAIKENTAKIDKEISDRQNDINRVDKAIAANTSKINQEITDRTNEITRVDGDISTLTAKIDKEIVDRTNEITRVDEAINANTAKIDKEIKDRKNEISRVDGAISANTEKINQEITDRTNEINRVDNKITALEDKSTTTDTQIVALDKATKDNKAKIDQEIANRRYEINRVDGAIEANTAKINKEITDRQNEITRVDGAINANTAKINKEIQDRQNEITRVEGKIPTDIGTVNLIKGTGSSFVMGFGITNTTWNETKKQSILDFSVPGVIRDIKNEILPQGDKFFDFKPIKGTTYTQSIMIDTDATFNPNGQALCTWFTSNSHNPQKAYIKKVGDHSYQVWSTYTWNLENTALRAFDWWDLHNVLLFRTTGTYLAFYKPKLTSGNLPSDWSPAPEDVEALIAQKQDKLTAGTGISIQGNVISATGDSAPQHDTQKEQVLASTQNTITITHGTNGTSETTKVDTNPEKVLEHSNLLTDYGIIKNTTGNTTKLGLEYTIVPDGFDLNTLTSGNIRGSKLTNAPSNNDLYYIQSFGNTTGNNVIQTAFKRVDSHSKIANIFRRYKINNSWGEWCEQVGDKSVIDTAISANTTKINQEITDRKSEITRVEGKIPTSIGVRNLWIQSKATGGFVEETLPDNHITGQKKCYRISNNAEIKFNIEPNFSSRLYQKVTFSAWVKYENVVQGANGWNMFNCFKHELYYKNSSTGATTNLSHLTLEGFTGTSDWKRITYTYDYSANKSYDQLKTSIRFNLEDVRSGTAWVTGVKIEIGSIPSDYTPALEDNDSKLNAVKSEIKQTTDSITTKINQEITDRNSEITRVEGKIPTSIDTVNLVEGTGSAFVMGYGITNTTWNETKKQTILDFSVPGVRRDIESEILPQGNKFSDFKPIKGTTYTQSIMIDTDATFNPNGQAQCSWFTNHGHNTQKAYIKKVGEHTYQVWSTYTFNLENTSLRVFDWFDLHNVLLFRTTGTYLAFYKPKLTSGNLPSDWSPAPEDYYSKLSTLEEKVAELQGKAYKKINIETADYTGYYSVYDGKVIKYDVTAKDGKYLDLRNFTFSDGKGPITGVTFDSNSLSVIYKIYDDVHLHKLMTYDNYAKFSINDQNKIVIDPSSTSQLLRNNLDKVTSFSYVTMDPNYEY